MKKCFLLLLVVVIMALIITSCLPTPQVATLISTHDNKVLTPTPNVTHTPTMSDIASSTPSTTPEPSLISTLWPYPTPRDISDYPDQVTDGILLFTIEAVDNLCHRIGEPIKIKVIFTNVSEQPISIAADFHVAPSIQGINGNLLPYISTINGERLYRPGDVSHYDTFPPTPNTYVTISANHAFTTVIDYFFPSSFVKITPIPLEVLSTPTPGQYFVKFSYVEYEKDANTWFGIVGSNRILICIH